MIHISATDIKLSKILVIHTFPKASFSPKGKTMQQIKLGCSQVFVANDMFVMTLMIKFHLPFTYYNI